MKENGNFYFKIVKDNLKKIIVLHRFIQLSSTIYCIKCISLKKISDQKMKSIMITDKSIVVFHRVATSLFIIICR